MAHAIAGSAIKFCGIYVIGDRTKKNPVAIGYINDVFEIGHDVGDSVILASDFVVDWRLARRIVKRCGWLLDAAKRVIIHPDQYGYGGLYDIDAEWAKKVIAVATREEGIPIYSRAVLKNLETTPGDLKLQQIELTLGRLAGL